ncbi:MAG TPA: transporter substrate-binding domain-containing protein, partial [Spirochaetota bacterium]
IRISKLDDMHGYRIGTIQNDVRELYLVSKGFDLSSLQRITGTDTYERNIRKLAMGRIDLLPMPDETLTYVSKKIGFNPSLLFKRAFHLEELSDHGYSLAASTTTDKDLIERLRAELLRFKKTPEYQKIFEQWKMSPPKS